MGSHKTFTKRVYCALIRSSIDYGRIIYGSASNVLLIKIDTIQSQALRICCGAVRSSPVTSLQVEMGEMPLDLRELQLRLVYWANIKGHFSNHPVKNVLGNCWEYEQSQVKSFGWIVEQQTQQIGVNINTSPTVALPVSPPWLFKMPSVDLQIFKTIKDKQNQVPKAIVVQKHLESEYSHYLQMVPKTQ